MVDSIYPAPLTLGEIVDASRLGHGRLDASAEALTDGTTSVDWSGYVDRVARLAGALIEAGARPGDRIGIRLSKSVESFVAVHAVLRAGAVMVPLDPLAPVAHSINVLTDAGAEMLVTDGRTTEVEQLVTGAALGAVVTPKSDAAPNVPDGVDAIVRSRIETTEPAAAVRVGPDDPAYIIYTSGSTGGPKGIVHSHRSALAYARTAADVYGLTLSDRLANIAPLHFDQSTFELYAAPLVGAAVIVVPDPILRFPASLSELIESQRATVWYSVPYLLGLLSTRGALDARDLSALRWVLFGGESFPPGQLAQLMQQLPSARFSNVYGPAEVNQCSMYHLSTPPAEDDPVPIGRAWPAAEFRIVVADHDDPTTARLVPRGEPGVLMVHTATMMSGYWNRASEAIVELAGERWYVTGDLVVERPDGNLVFLGRTDNQIKLRGHRIELESIDAVLGDIDDVAEGTVVVRRPVEGDDSLVVLVVLRSESDDHASSLAGVHDELRRRLPRYAVPAEVLEVHSLPRTGTGKIDRNAATLQLGS